MKTYYQPELTDEFLNKNSDFYSFFVFRNKKLAEKVFPDSKVLTYTGGDIEKPQYVDYMYDSPVYHIKLDGLNKALKQKLGVPVVVRGEIKPSFMGRGDLRSRVRMELSTTNLVVTTGIFKNFFSEVEIGNHGGGIPSDNDIIWFNLHIYYKHVNGGSNGIKIADAYWDYRQKLWKIKFEDEDEVKEYK